MPLPFYDLGPCGVTFNSVDLGDNNSVRVFMEQTSADVTYATQGTDVIDTILTGQPTRVEVDMMGSSLAQLEDVFPGSSVTGSELMFGSVVGTSMRANAAQLILKPYSGGSPTSDQTKWLTFFMAHPKSATEFTFDLETNRMVRTVFSIFKVLSSDTIPSGETYTAGDTWALGYGETS